MSANREIEKTRKALETVRLEMLAEGNAKAAAAIEDVLASEMSVLRLAAILAPKN